jgi:hypothetical protein
MSNQLQKLVSLLALLTLAALGGVATLLWTANQIPDPFVFFPIHRSETKAVTIPRPIQPPAGNTILK